MTSNINYNSIILFKVENGVGYIVLNMPDKANAMTAELKNELTKVLQKVGEDDQVRAVVITGNGKVFCAGGDLSTMGESQTAVEGRERMKNAAIWVKKLANLEKPTIAAVNGSAFGSGLSLALACDFIIASQTANFSCSFIKVGLVADTGALYYLPRRVGWGKAKQLVFTGETINGAEAEKIGLVDWAVPPEELMTRVQDFAEKLANGPTYAIGMNKKILSQSFETSLNALLDMEATFQAVAFQTSDHQEAVKAFFDKSSPRFTGK